MERINNAAPKRIGRPYTYELSFMRQVVSAYLTGDEGYVKLAHRFNVSRHQVKQWVAKFSSDLGPTINPTTSMTQQEQQELEALKNQKKELEKQLELATMKIMGLQTLIDVAEDTLKIDIRKKSGSRQSKK